MKRLFPLIFLVAILVLSFISCRKYAPEDNFTEAPAIKDEFGRTLILHGLNTSSNSKYGNYLPWINEMDVEREDKAFGFNFVRLLTSWAAIEPERGVYNEDYLNAFEERVNWYTSRGMHVLIDMHQDVYGAAVGGNGAPDWACVTNGADPIDLSGLPWWVKNIDPTVINSYLNFWRYTEHSYLQDHQIMAWEKIVLRFRDNPYVIGYELMNEPHGGDLVKTLNGTFEKTWLIDFYNRLIPAIRNLDPDKYIFFEPRSLGVNFGQPSGLPKVNDTRSPQKLVYAPHIYPLGTDISGAYVDLDRQQMEEWRANRLKEIKLHGTPVMVGEFGLSPTIPGFNQYLTDLHNMMDGMLGSWAYWSNDKGGWSPFNEDRSETPIAIHLLRTYPRATAGKLRSFSFNPDTRLFRMEFFSDPGLGQPTEIFVPERHYPGGWELSLSGTDRYTTTRDEARQLLFLNVENSRKIVVEIRAK
jgi:endoglycosylceramidase